MHSRSITSKTTLPPAALAVAVALLVFAALGPNSVLAVLAVAVLFLGSWVLWRPGESPILLFVFGYQWLQASIKVFHANWQGADVATLAPYGGDVRLAIVLSLLGLAFLALGMRVGVGAWHPQDSALIRSNASRHGPQYWFQLYVVALLLAAFAQSTTWVIPGLSQPLIALASLKWAFFWILAYATFVQPGTSRLYWLLAFGLEMLLGLGGYFADFKTPLFFTLLALVAAELRLRAGHYLGLLSIGALALILGIAWTAVKEEYRSFASGGQEAQVVTGSYSGRVSKLADLVAQLDGNAMADASERFLQRLSYVDFFGIVLDTVPRVRAHEGGALWWDAVSRPFMPRLFFPGKTAIDDSARTNYYTGLRFAGSQEGTSISIGYMGEAYIDFGTVGMMAPIFALGLLLGSFYRWMLRLDPSRLLAMALATATIYGAAFLESSITKVFGGLIVAMLVSWIILRFIAPRYLPWMGNSVVR